MQLYRKKQRQSNEIKNFKTKKKTKKNWQLTRQLEWTVSIFFYIFLIYICSFRTIYVMCVLEKCKKFSFWEMWHTYTYMHELSRNRNENKNAWFLCWHLQFHIMFCCCIIGVAGGWLSELSKWLNTNGSTFGSTITTWMYSVRIRFYSLTSRPTQIKTDWSRPKS